jgi:hypothetical protein
MTPNGPRFGPVISPKDKLNIPYAWGGPVLFWQPERRDRAYLLAEESGYISPPKNGRGYETTSLKLLTLDLSGTSSDPVVHRLDLLRLLTDAQSQARAYQSGHRLFVASGATVAEVDLSGDTPRVAGTIDVSTPVPMGGGRKMSMLWSYYGESHLPSGQVVIDIPVVPIAGMSPRECLKARLALGLSNQRAAMEGDLLIGASEKDVSAYRLSTIDDKTARFILEGRMEHSPLERLFGCYASGIQTINGLAYVQESRIGVGMSVYDVRDPTKPRSIGHFAAPKASILSVAHLPGGELLLAADRLYVLKSPAAALQ